LAGSARDVFINCPFDDAFASGFRALVFAVMACGFRARCARETDDGAQDRSQALTASWLIRRPAAASASASIASKRVSAISDMSGAYHLAIGRRKGPLVAYRFGGETELSAGKFAWV
jgi:hypothetical protein